MDDLEEIDDNGPEEWGCHYCRNDGKLTPMGTCPKCDAEYPNENY